VETGFGGLSGVEVKATLNPQQEFKTFTNGRGEYSVRVPLAGQFRVGAVLDGYVLVNATGMAKVDAAQPKSEAHFEMTRMVRITGRVVDDGTGEPIEGVRVSAQIVRNAEDGLRVMVPTVRLVQAGSLQDAMLRDRGPQSRPVTDAEGTFELFVMPGSYVAGVVSPFMGMVAYKSEETNKVDAEYQRLYWPGGVSLADVRPMDLRSGALMDLGDLRVKKAPRYRAHVAIPQGDCPQGESVRLMFAQRGERAPVESVPTTSVFACGSDVLLRGLDPGTYALYAVSDWQGERDNLEGAVWGRAEFAIEKENAEVTLDLHHGAILEGGFKPAEGSSATPARLGIAAQPMDVLFGRNPGPEQFIEWLEDGRFRLAVGLGQQMLIMRGENGSYVSKLSFNGAPVKGMTLEVKSGERQWLEVELDNKKGTIEGMVDGIARTVMVWDGAGLTMNQASVIDRKFQIEVAPGEYVVNVMDSPLFYQAADMARASGVKVVVKPGETAKVAISVR
jgi:hypothetical protein